MTQQPRSTFVLRDPSEILEALVGLKDVVVLHYERHGPDVKLAIEQLIRGPVHCPSCAGEARVKERPVSRQTPPESDGPVKQHVGNVLRDFK